MVFSRVLVSRFGQKKIPASLVKEQQEFNKVTYYEKTYLQIKYFFGTSQLPLSERIDSQGKR